MGRPEGRGTSTREDLSVFFHATVETLEDQILYAVVLGVLVAILAVVGVDQSSNRRSVTT